jgi:polysaccharide export outer membrane protein
MRRVVGAILLPILASGSQIGCGSSLSTDLSGAGGSQLIANEKGSDTKVGSVKPAAALGGETGLSTAKPRSSAAQAARRYTEAATPGAPGYRIGPLDVIEVAVYKVPDLTKTVQVADAGTVSLPLVGEIHVMGRTAQEVERDLTRRLGAKYLQDPQVNIYIREYNSQRVTLEGAVKTPGVFPLKGKTTLLQTVASAGGLTESADSTVVVFREDNGKRAAAKFDLDDIRSGTAEDPTLRAGDVIVVSNSMMKAGMSNVLKMLPLVGLFALL